MIKKTKFITMRTNILIVIFLVVLVSCDKEYSTPSDEFTLKSNQINGFSFEKLKVIDFPYTENLKPDFLVLPQLFANWQVGLPFLTHPDLESRFFLSGSFENYENALIEYNSFIIPDNYHLEQNAFGIQPNQVWLIKTNSEMIGVILIKSAKIYYDNKGPYAETTFKAKIMN